MYFRRSKIMPICSGELVDHEFVKDGLNVLEIGHVPACTDHGVLTNGMQTLNILESCERSIGRWSDWSRVD